MKKFVKITTRFPDGSIQRTWIGQQEILQLTQNSVTQGGENEGTCELIDGEIIDIIDFNATIESLS
jgi:hypothetical protein